MATLVKHYWGRGSEYTLDDVKLVRAGRAWNNVNNIVGVWNSALLSYEFEIDIDDAAQFDGTVQHEIWEGDGAGDGSVVIEELDLGSIRAEVDLAAHEALTAAHGATGAVVGTTNTQTLTNKTIDGGNNTLSVRPSQLKGVSDSALPGVKSKPNTGEDTLLHIDTASATAVTMQAANDAKSADRHLSIIAGQLNLDNRTGADIIVRGVAAPVNSNDAVPKSVTDALDTRLDALEVGGVIVPGDVILRTRTRGVWNITASMTMSPVSENANVARWELYWSEIDDFAAVSAGLITSDDLDYLRAHGARIVLPGGQAQVATLFNDQTTHLIAVAIDATGVAYASPSVTQAPLFRGLLGRDGETMQIQAPGAANVGTGSFAAAAAGQVAAAFIDMEETSASAVIKARIPYRHATDIEALQISLHAYKATSGVGTISIALYDSAGALVGSAQTLVVLNDSAFALYNFNFDLTGIAAGLYELRFSVISDGTNKTHLRSDIQIDPVRTLTFV